MKRLAVVALLVAVAISGCHRIPVDVPEKRGPVDIRPL